jgi:hypothetical protein
MLIYAPFALCFVILRDVFMHFLESYTGNILRIGRNKSQSSYFLDTRWSPKQRQRGPAGDRTIGWRGLPLDRATRWWGHLAHLLTSPFCLYILLDEKTLRTQLIFQKTYCKSPPSSTRDREGPEALPGTLPERGITTEGLLHHHAYLQSDVWVVYLGLRVHSSSYMDIFSSMCFIFRSCKLPIMIKIIVM